MDSLNSFVFRKAETKDIESACELFKTSVSTLCSKHYSKEEITSLFKQANYKCQYKSPLTQKQCSATHFLEVDHIIPIALGGSNEIQNLRILCREHNTLAAKQNGLCV